MKKTLLIFLIIILIGCGKKEEKKIMESKFTFGTMINIVVYSDNEKEARRAIKLAFEELERIDNKFNTHKKGSLIYKVNNNPKEYFQLDDEGQYLFDMVKETYELSNGQYDITITPLIDLWGFVETREREKVPLKQELEEAIKRVDFDNIDIKNNQIRLLTPKNKIDTGSFLKGYAISRAKGILEENGIKGAFISAISSIETLNVKPNGETWKIGLQNPENPNKEYHILEIDNKSIGVSGDYQIYVEIDGKKYHHLLDKTTGYPVGDKKMVVVIGENGFLTDMYSTAFFSMPAGDILDFVNETIGLEVMIVKSDMSKIFSENFEEYMVK